MITMENFKAEHIDEMTDQVEQVVGRLTSKNAKGYEEYSDARTMRDLDGRVVCCAGIRKIWDGRGEAWAVFDKKVRNEFLSVHRIVRKFLDASPLKRVEASVFVDFEAGHRWVKALGFKLEAPSRKGYWPGGIDAALYSRVRDA